MKTKIFLSITVVFLFIYSCSPEPDIRDIEISFLKKEVKDLTKEKDSIRNELMKCDNMLQITEESLKSK